MKKKVPNFKAPDGYFEGFMDRLKDRMDEKSPLIPEEDGFGIPEGYFEEFGDRLQNSLPPAEQAKGRVVKFQPWMYAAAAGVALLLLLFNQNYSSDKPLDFTDLAYTELDAYWEETELELTALELSDWDEADLEALSAETLELESEELLDYLQLELEIDEQENLYNTELILDNDEEN